MMRFSVLLFSVVSGLLIGESVASSSSFHRDVVAKVAKKERRQLPFISGGGKASHSKQNVQDDLLAKAIPLADYEKELKSLGVELPTSSTSSAESAKNGDAATRRRLDEDNEADDYYISEQYMYSFSGYSMKYARCQPIQQFSEDALAAGEYSPMVTQDIVILRLCPYKSCSSSRQYGCHYNYAEYAIGLFDYMRIMLRHRADKKERLCEWCADCKGRRKLDEAQDDQAAEEANDDGDDQSQNDDGDDNAQDDDYYAYNGNDDGGNDDNSNNNANSYAYYDENDDCYNYGSYCNNYYYDCQVDAEDDTYLAEDEYYDYLGCTELADNYGGVYFVRPTCDTSTETIVMAVYYDEYCSQSASSAANMANFKIAFNDTLFEDFYSGSCMDCSESNYPPAFNANSYMCNKIHFAGADCTTNMVYDLFDGQTSDSTECSFIESIRFGTYDANGEIASEASESAEEIVTTLQKLGLVTTAFVCALFVIYACYLHHSMTNLLIKSLSHRELLPPSRHNRRRSPTRSNSKRTRRSSKSSKGSRRGDDDDDDEWDRSKPLRSPV